MIHGVNEEVMIDIHFVADEPLLQRLTN